MHISISKQLSSYTWKYDDYFGSSLTYITKKMEAKNYRLVSTNISGSNAFYVLNDLAPLCITNGQSILDLYMPPNYNLFDYYSTHKPTLKFLVDILRD